jgi:hypothetical protein
LKIPKVAVQFGVCCHTSYLTLILLSLLNLLLDLLHGFKLSYVLKVEISRSIKARGMQQRKNGGYEFLNAAAELSIMCRTKLFHDYLADACAHIEYSLTIFFTQVGQD